jgi:hypothetical protein
MGRTYPLEAPQQNLLGDDMSLIDRIRTCQIWTRPLPAVSHRGPEVGWATGDFAERLREFPKLFRVSAGAVDLDPGLSGFEQRSGQCGSPAAPGPRAHRAGAALSVGSDFYAPPLMQMERAAVPLFGVRAYRCMEWLRGFRTISSSGSASAASKQTAPGKLDHLVAGGWPWASACGECDQESAEEAG